MKITKSFEASKSGGVPYGSIMQLKNGFVEPYFSGHFQGTPEAGGTVSIEVDAGEIVSFGQKNGVHSRYLVDDDGGLSEVTTATAERYIRRMGRSRK